MEAGQVDRLPVLLLHGIGGNSLHWRYQLAGLANRFRLIAWNAPGYLLSGGRGMPYGRWSTITRRRRLARLVY
jgi:pimeloyl-ACP methyl ester carboxylesterase